MDPQAFELLVKQVDRIEKRVDALWEFRWMVAGAASVAGAAAGFIGSVILIWMKAQ